MDIWIIIASLAIILTSIQLFPQVYKSLKTRKVRDLSLGLCVIVALGAATWIVYGIHIKEWPIITANVLNLIAALVLFALKVRE